MPLCTKHYTNLWRQPKGELVYVLSDSQVTLEALVSYKITSKLVFNCPQNLSTLAKWNRVRTSWMKQLSILNVFQLWFNQWKSIVLVVEPLLNHVQHLTSFVQLGLVGAGAYVCIGQWNCRPASKDQFRSYLHRTWIMSCKFRTCSAVYIDWVEGNTTSPLVETHTRTEV